MTAEHIVNPALIQFAKRAFIPGGDPSAGGDPAAQGGMPPGGDPSGGAPGGDPAGGMAPPTPDPMAAQLQQMQQQIQQLQAGGGAGAGGAGALKPKIDQNVVSMQILKILARIADQLGVQIPASEMVVGQQDLMGMAQATQSGSPLPGMDPTAGGAGGQPAGGGQPPGGVGPVGPAPGLGGKSASWQPDGRAFDPAELGGTANAASATLLILQRRRGG